VPIQAESRTRGSTGNRVDPIGVRATTGASAGSHRVAAMAHGIGACATTTLDSGVAVRAVTVDAITAVAFKERKPNPTRKADTASGPVAARSTAAEPAEIGIARARRAVVDFPAAAERSADAVLAVISAPTSAFARTSASA